MVITLNFFTRPVFRCCSLGAHFPLSSFPKFSFVFILFCPILDSVLCLYISVCCRRDTDDKESENWNNNCPEMETRREGRPQRDRTTATENGHRESILLGAGRNVGLESITKKAAALERRIMEKRRIRSQKTAESKSGLKHLFLNFLFGFTFYGILIGIWIYK